MARAMRRASAAAAGRLSHCNWQNVANRIACLLVNVGRYFLAVVIVKPFEKLEKW